MVEIPDDVPPIPPAIIKYAEQNQMTNVRQSEFWNYYNENEGYFHGYKVYYADRKDLPPFIYYYTLKEQKKYGVEPYRVYPKRAVLLYKNGKIRRATEEEAKEATKLYY